MNRRKRKPATTGVILQPRRSRASRAASADPPAETPATAWSAVGDDQAGHRAASDAGVPQEEWHTRGARALIPVLHIRRGIHLASIHDPVNFCALYGQKVFVLKKVFVITTIPMGLFWG